MAATVKDVARLAGVSTITVSRVINEHPRVREETREKVLDAIRKLNYYPNRNARSLVVRRSQCLAVVVPKSAGFLFENPFYSMVLKGITHVAESRGYHIVLSTVARNGDCLTLYRERLIDGAILLSVGRSERSVLALYNEGVPFVMTSRFLPELDVNYVEVDNQSGARQAVRHLLERGHQRIAFINGSSDLANCHDRLVGFRETLVEAGLFDESLVVETEFTEEAGYKATQVLLQAQPVDAIFTAADITAVGAILAIRDKKLKIPRDIAVVGFDGIPISRYVDPPLTTVEQPAYEKGVKAAETLLDILESKVEPPVQVMLPTRLVVRQST